MSNKASFYTNLTFTCANLSKNLRFAICVVFQTFYPNLPIFLHRYICHIHDHGILQLPKEYPDQLPSCLLREAIALNKTVFYEKKNHKMLTRPPGRGFVKSSSFFGPISPFVSLFEEKNKVS